MVIILNKTELKFVFITVVQFVTELRLIRAAGTEMKQPNLRKRSPAHTQIKQLNSGTDNAVCKAAVGCTAHQILFGGSNREEWDGRIT